MDIFDPEYAREQLAVKSVEELSQIIAGGLAHYRVEMLELVRTELQARGETETLAVAEEMAERERERAAEAEHKEWLAKRRRDPVSSVGGIFCGALAFGVVKLGLGDDSFALQALAFIGGNVAFRLLHALLKGSDDAEPRI